VSTVAEDIAPGRPTIRLADGTEFGLTMKAETVAALWQISTWGLYSSVRRGDCPVSPIRVGTRVLRWPTIAVLASVGIVATVESGP
jgi:predicted DNA-binding transcriptional regulator AlpA